MSRKDDDQTSAGTLDGDEEWHVVDDPSGTAESKKTTPAAIATYSAGSFIRRDGTNSPTATIDWDNQDLVDVNQIGIGVQSPSEQLEVHSATGVVELSIESPNSSCNLDFEVQRDTSSQAWGIRARALRWTVRDRTAGTDALTVAKGGNVGVLTNSPGSSLAVNGSLGTSSTTVTTTTATIDHHHAVLVDDDTAGAAVTVTLTNVAERQYHVKKLGTTGNVTVQLDSGNIDGAATSVITAQYGSVHVFCDGTNGHLL